MNREEAYRMAEIMMIKGVRWPKIIDETHLEISDLKKIKRRR